MQERILNFDSLLRNVYLKTSSNPEAEKILKKIEEKAKEEVFTVCKTLGYKTEFSSRPFRKYKKEEETKKEKEAFLNEIKQYEKEKENIKKNAEKVFAMLVHDGMQGIRINAGEKKFAVKLENIVPGNDACVMLKILQELADVAEASWVLTVEFGEMSNSGWWRSPGRNGMNLWKTRLDWTWWSTNLEKIMRKENNGKCIVH